MFKRLFNFKPFRYIFAGGTGLLVNIGTLFILVHTFKLWYLLATILAFLISSCVSFLMQKLLTFADRTMARAHIQLGAFFIIAACNLGVNTFLMYLAVSLLTVQYLLAQFLVNAFIAVYSFFLYKYIVFRKSDTIALTDLA